MTTDRREFLATLAAGAAAGGALPGTVLAAPAVLPHRRPDPIRIGLIGCGGRGTGAARNCVEGAEGIELVAMGDLFENRLDQSKEQLAPHLGDAFKVTPATSFIGFDAWQGVLASPIDMVILATPPAFRPGHLAAAIDAGKHVFMEKPVAVCPAGIRDVIASSDRARERGLAIVAGTQRRHQARYLETIGRLRQGAIGSVLSGQVYWNQGGLWKADRKPGMSDTEWQIRNWLYFTWLSGDHIVEQHVHNIDVANWVMGSHPIRAVGVGGRQVRVDPAYGHVFDHFGIEFEYPSGARVFSMCRQQDGAARHVGEFFLGTEGTSDAAGLIRGRTAWRFRLPEGTEEVSPYQQEHTDLVASIRAGSPLNEGRQIAESNLTAIMGREAAYTGQVIGWEELAASDLDLRLPVAGFGDLAMPPVAAPGVTQLSRGVFDHARGGAR